jgi:hypothetical protein
MPNAPPTSPRIQSRVVKVITLAALLSFAFLYFFDEFKDESFRADKGVSKHTKHEQRIVTSWCTNETSTPVGETIPEGWCLDNVNRVRYVGVHNKLDGNISSPATTTSIQHYTHDGYDHCLANKTVVFIGDSRVRYQYMHLSDYLNNRRFMTCQDQSTQPDTECYLIDHESHQRMQGKNWLEWYTQSTHMLDTGDFSLFYSGSIQPNQTGLCDCYRPNPFNPVYTYENRFITRTTQNGELNLIYLQSFNNLIRMNEDYPPYALSSPASSKRCKTGECNASNRLDAFQGDLNATLWEVLPKLNTTHAFVSLGWEHLYRFTAQSEFSCVIQDFVSQHPGMKIYFISHPPVQKDLSNPSDVFDGKKLKCDIDYLDRTSMHKGVPASWYWDKQHVLSILNEEYNHRLIESICPINSTQ